MLVYSDPDIRQYPDAAKDIKCGGTCYIRGEGKKVFMRVSKSFDFRTALAFVDLESGEAKYIKAADAVCAAAFQATPELDPF